MRGRGKDLENGPATHKTGGLRLARGLKMTIRVPLRRVLSITASARLLEAQR